jgi:hypothetical protein
MAGLLLLYDGRRATSPSPRPSISPRSTSARSRGLIDACTLQNACVWPEDGGSPVGLPRFLTYMKPFCVKYWNNEPE